MKFEFKLKRNLNSLRPINNEIESIEDADSMTDESSIFDSIPTSNSISVISEDIEEKKTFSRPISCYTTPPLSNASLTYKTFEKLPNRDLIRKSSWLGSLVSTSLKRKEDFYIKNNNTLDSTEDFDYSSINNDGRRQEFYQNLDIGNGATEEQFIIVDNKEQTKFDLDTLDDNSFTLTSTSFHSEDVSNISCSTIQSNNRIHRNARMKPEFDQNIVRDRLSFLQPTSSSMKIKIYINEKDQLEDVIALKVQKERLQDINVLIDIIISKITSMRSDINRENIKLFLVFKQESIRPILLSKTPRKTFNESNLNLFDNTSLIMDYLSGKEKLYIRALV
ncbi:DEHA2G15246p [Debaryomyces hansenii CBS767]|jgi:hypothetical protein|uniref:DEHA2G15246p n=1 Tax=Debaryomyces hansenii (strain ATCC 36239 / CBS 767 / BCRC 21394 / JCM 1990 / NBRC 0083 / IGC 2968) TaxID=284592 RepID=Q6BHW7_DEBHA|nr:DEHA2G15246p [Debaryomyces hansenii CBS767]CAG90696.1 DEHA2G15246p [Debaryomyces hansenii CBS767]|eukprot:XP_462204.1 DEHA2G15246p [Debaryomyces hansenii CBS767]